MPAREKLFDGVQKAVAEGRQAGIDQAKRRRQDRAEKILRTSRRKRRVACDRSMAAGSSQLSAISCRKAVLSDAASIESQRRHKPGFRPSGADALAIMAMPQVAGAETDAPLKSFASSMRHPQKEPPTSIRQRDLTEVFGKRGAAPINSGSLPTSRQTPKSYKHHKVVIV